MGPLSQTKRRRRRIGVTLAAALVLASGIVGVRAIRDRGPSPTPIRQWVAVLDVGPSAPALYTQAAAVGKVAGVYVFVDRWACYSGFPAGTSRAGGDWILGVAATDRTVVDGIVARLGQTPVVEAEVEQGCAPTVDTTPDINQT